MKECEGCPAYSGTDCLMPTPEFGCPKATQGAAIALLDFLRTNCGEGKDSVIEIVSNGEHSDLYGEHLASLLQDIESCVK
jgi:hypothetical protein